MGFVKLVVFGFIGLTVIYLSLALYSRSVRREKLEKEYDASPVEDMSRNEFVAKGIQEYNQGIRPKLLLLVYVVPTLLLISNIYLTNN